MEEKLIKFKNVRKEYKGGIIALEDVSFSLDSGEFIFIVGPSGAGKSTIVRLLIRAEHPTAGEIVFEEIDVPSIPRKLLSIYRQQLGIVFQDLKLISRKTVRENIHFALEITDKSESEILDTTDYLLDLVNLSNRSELFPRQLSGGEMQRVALARALANEPKLLIADEPTGNLDHKTADGILSLLDTVNSLGTTVMVITHDKAIVDRMQRRVIHLDKGRVVADEQGGYEANGKGKKTKDTTKLKSKKKDKVEAKKTEQTMKKGAKGKTYIEVLDLPKKLVRKLNKTNVKDLEKLLDMSEEELKKAKFKKKEITKINKAVESYLSNK